MASLTTTTLTFINSISTSTAQTTLTTTAITTTIASSTATLTSAILSSTSSIINSFTTQSPIVVITTAASSPSSTATSTAILSKQPDSEILESQVKIGLIITGSILAVLLVIALIYGHVKRNSRLQQRLHSEEIDQRLQSTTSNAPSQSTNSITNPMQQVLYSGSNDKRISVISYGNPTKDLNHNLPDIPIPRQSPYYPAEQAYISQNNSNYYQEQVSIISDPFIRASNTSYHLPEFPYTPENHQMLDSDSVYEKQEGILQSYHDDTVEKYIKRDY